jgi:hypothetical protein
MRITLFALVVISLIEPANAQQPPQQPTHEKAIPIQDAPCEWFTKPDPDTWATDHFVIIGHGISIGRVALQRRIFPMSDGTDVYDYLEAKCGKKD